MSEPSGGGSAAVVAEVPVAEVPVEAVDAVCVEEVVPVSLETSVVHDCDDTVAAEIPEVAAKRDLEEKKIHVVPLPVVEASLKNDLLSGLTVALVCSWN
ncbi:hypothetical protein KIPB_012226 [Kipferlia bialata]|uniref:Uncharacterized protein n=1 Tax=Kipferlia bialata TaxID=797122 RepID=A0A391NQW1_9EUKA|nr:hypothetical protein KIPB_012226 [Kipferlia bialata]|eukprot:g12226.t1